MHIQTQKCISDLAEGKNLVTLALWHPLDFASLAQIFSVFIPVHLSHLLPGFLAGILPLGVCTHEVLISLLPGYLELFFHAFIHLFSSSLPCLPRLLLLYKKEQLKLFLDQWWEK